MLNHCKLPFFGLTLVSLLLLGAGCRSNHLSESKDAAVLAPTFTQSCGPNRTTLGYRNPATQACETTPPSGREMAFSAFDMLYSSANSSPTTVTMAVVSFNVNLSTERALAVLNAIHSTDSATLSMRLPSFRGGTSLPLELLPAERATLETVQTALGQTVASRGYTPAELVELHRVVADDTVVAGVVVRATVRDLHAFWHENPDLVRTVTFDLPLSK